MFLSDKKLLLQEVKLAELHRTTIGGQALIEGIMMKGPFKTAMAVRTKEGDITLEEKDAKEKKWYNKAPFIRGSINFVTQLSEGYTYLSRSMKLSGMADDDGEEEMSKFEKWLDDKFGDKIMGVVMSISMVLGIGLAIVLFLFVPTWLFMLVQYLAGEGVDLSPFQSLFEGSKLNPVEQADIFIKKIRDISFLTERDISYAAEKIGADFEL